MRVERGYILYLGVDGTSSAVLVPVALFEKTSRISQEKSLFDRALSTGSVQVLIVRIVQRILEFVLYL